MKRLNNSGKRTETAMEYITGDVISNIGTQYLPGRN
jgi:hypothetical protein